LPQLTKKQATNNKKSLFTIINYIFKNPKDRKHNDLKYKNGE